MKGDFSRRTFDRQRHFRSVRMQRGRVQLDADWNEQFDLQLARLETLAADLVGVAGVPMVPVPGGVRQAATGFQVFLSGGKPAARAGRLYAGGLLCELEADTLLDAQADLPGYGLPTTGGRYLAYLDAWEEHVTALDDPDLADPALGGADTATRSRVVAQVKLAPVSGDATPPLFPPGWSPGGDSAPPPPALAARSAGAPADNELFRVEVHQGGGLGAATFKWSRDNGVAVAVVAAVAGNDLTLASPPSPGPQKLFAAGQWVEVTSRAAGLRGTPGALVRLLRVQGSVLTVEGWPPGTPPPAVDRVRRWDSPGEVPLAIPAGNDGYLPLADGVEVRFAGAADAVAATGDYWLIPSRAAAGVLWPVGAGGEPAARQPEGIRHRYAPLALLDLATGAWSLAGDCRRPFDPAVQLPAIAKVSRAGDKMTGALIIQKDLFVTGQVHAGGEAAPPAGVKLAVSGGVLRVYQNSGLAFPSLPGGSTASLRHVGTGLTVEVTAASDRSESLRLFQNGADRMVFAGGRVGIGVAEPAVSLDVGGLLRTTDLEVDGSLALVDGSQGAGLVLTLDNTGSARWQQVPQPTFVKPVFFDTPFDIASGTSSQINWTPYLFGLNRHALQPGTTAVILEAEAAAGGPDSGAIDSYIRVRKDSSPDSPWVVVLRGRCAGDEDSAAWAGQAVCPVTAVGSDFLINYSVQAFAGDPDTNPTGPAFDGNWRLSVVGYFL
ncbi:MAG TPA: DUF6519 domain-containing protein [Thermoanaerobaculia bacterium]|nr:DUF6519 domain-containing protein [Thermoanaerobaculia bacterium]